MPLCDLSRETFVQYLSGLYEHSAWVLERAYNTGLTAGHDNPELLARAFQQSLNDASKDEKLALIRSYPDVLGKAAMAGHLSRSANDEFASAGLARCTPVQIDRFGKLNGLYWARFGFPFVMAIQDSSIDRILKELAERLPNDTDTEIQNALNQIHRIARLRLDKLLPNERNLHGMDTPLAHPVGMGVDVVSNAEQHVAGKHDPESLDEKVSGLWKTRDKPRRKPGLFSRIVDSQLPVVRRSFCKVSELFTPVTILACALSFGCGWMFSRILS